MDSKNLLEKLDAALAESGLVLESGEKKQILSYLDLLTKWNKVYNLTAIRAPEDMLTHHVLDSLSVIPHLKPYVSTRSNRAAPVRLLDVGSGGGLPGVLIAICCPSIHVDCVDTVGKKAVFIQQVASALGLKNLAGFHQRVEKLEGFYDVVVSRAFASLKNFTDWSMHTLAADGIWLAMKGKFPAAELEELTDAVEMFHVEQIQVPYLNAERCLLFLRKRKTLQSE